MTTHALSVSWSTISPEVLQHAQAELHTIRDFVRFIVTQLRAHDVDLGQGTTDYFAEAAALVMQPLHLEWSISPEILDAKLLSHEKEDVLQLVEARINLRTPTAYLLNLAYFCDLPFYVDERVLIPRSPIAELIKANFGPYFVNETHLDAAVFDFGLPLSDKAITPKRMLDLCTGSGCIAIALAQHFEEAEVDAIDISLDALEVAAVNVNHHNVGHQVALIESDLLAKIAPAHQYDLMVSNPPYVDAKDMAELPEEFQQEPELALAAGQDGLDIVLNILAVAADYLHPKGLLVVEVGNSEWALQQMFERVPFHWLRFSTGQHGVFALTAQECAEYQQLFRQKQQARYA